MTTGLVIGIVLGVFALLLLGGHYIHTILVAAGVLGVFLLEGPDILPALVGQQPFSRTASYTLTTIPLFVLMAQFIMQAGVVKDLFYVVSKVSRGRAGVLGTLTLGAGAMLGAVSGSGAATAASLGQVAVPELHRVGYSRELAGAIAASAGSLSGIIPPSIILILYGVATETPIGELFMGAVIPGILVTLAFIGVTLFQLRRERAKSSRTEHGAGESIVATTDSDYHPSVFRVALSLLISGFVVLVVFGGIFAGVVTPTEAGALGAFAAFIVALALGKVTLSFLKEGMLETVKVTGMVMLIIIAAQIFSRFVSLSLLPRKLIDALEPIAAYPPLMLFVLAILFFVLFMFLEGAAVILMSVPVVMPLIIAMDVDVLWFGVFLGVICSIGLLSPPVGLSVFAVAGATRIPSTAIFRHTLLVGAVAALVVCGLMVVFPQLVHWLPGLAG